MPRIPRTEVEESLRRQSRRLQWGFLAYLLVLLAIGIGILRLATGTRRFGEPQVTPMPVAAERGDDSSESPADGAIPVSGVEP